LKAVTVPEIFGERIIAFFTGKGIGADRVEIGRTFRISPDNIYLPIQKHTDKIVFLDAAREPKIGDAVITRQKGVLIGVQVADCVPVLVHEKEKGVIAAVHAGWRGTASGILKKTIEAVIDRYAGSASNIVIAIGPAIGGCSYEVGREVAVAVARESGKGGYCSRKGAKYYLDLPLANKQQAVSAGIPEENMWVSAECTFCNPDKFYSYRFSKGSTGRQGGFIGMRC
jgi:YfiH family protein